MNSTRSVELLLSLVLLTILGNRSTDGATSKLPSYIPLCKKTDTKFNECLLQATQVAIDKLRTGIPSMGVPTLDPLHVTALEIGQGQGPISINQKFTNITVLGLSDSKVHSVNADLKGYNLPYKGTVEKAIMEADYVMTGRILLLPVTGNGRCKLVFTKLAADLGPKGKEIVKKGKTYFDTTDFHLDINGLDNLHVHFDNLFNGDKTLGESMNRLMNENWKELWTELKPAFDQTFGSIFKHYTKTIFDKVPFDDIFLD